MSEGTSLTALKTCDFKRVYVWQIAVRGFHWINVGTLFLLAVTGFIIADPPALNINAEASQLFLMGYVRLIHFASAYIFVANLAFRIYWGFVGNRYAHARNFFPTTKKQLKNIWYVFKVDILLQEDKEHSLKNISIGHNAVAGFSYFLLFLLFVAQIATGFALFAPNATWFLPKMFKWVTAFMGSESNVRYLHHLVSWLIVIFSFVHMYLVFFHDYLEGRGESSSMISGYKFVRGERFKRAKEHGYVD
jgi:Ni/Fe-hydrogenase 1 B-type cytochrome subunit